MQAAQKEVQDNKEAAQRNANDLAQITRLLKEKVQKIEALETKNTDLQKVYDCRVEKDAKLILTYNEENQKYEVKYHEKNTLV